MSILKCSICYEGIISDIGCTRYCNHLFHYTCGTKYVNKYGTCPTCPKPNTDVVRLYTCGFDSNYGKTNTDMASLENLLIKINEIDDELRFLKLTEEEEQYEYDRFNEEHQETVDKINRIVEVSNDLYIEGQFLKKEIKKTLKQKKQLKKKKIPPPENFDFTSFDELTNAVEKEFRKRSVVFNLNEADDNIESYNDEIPRHYEYGISILKMIAKARSTNQKLRLRLEKVNREYKLFKKFQVDSHYRNELDDQDQNDYYHGNNEDTYENSQGLYESENDSMEELGCLLKGIFGDNNQDSRDGSIKTHFSDATPNQTPLSDYSESSTIESD